MDNIMSVHEQIEHRKILIDKVSRGENLSFLERQWLVTNPVFNSKLGPPYTNYEIITLPSNSTYNLIIRIERISYENRIIPIISVPSAKGKIVCDFPVTNFNGKTSVGKPIKMLGLESVIVSGETRIVYQSELGLIAVEYQCDYFDEKQNINVRKSSFSGDFNFAMLKEEVKCNKILFHCKNPKNDTLDALVFSIEYEKLHQETQGDGSLCSINPATKT